MQELLHALPLTTEAEGILGPSRQESLPISSWTQFKAQRLQHMHVQEEVAMLRGEIEALVTENEALKREKQVIETQYVLLKQDKEHLDPQASSYPVHCTTCKARIT